MTRPLVKLISRRKYIQDLLLIKCEEFVAVLIFTENLKLKLLVEVEESNALCKWNLADEDISYWLKEITGNGWILYLLV